MRAVSFQSRSGFLLSCDDSTNATALTTRTVEFQSRSGFLLSCDQSTQSHPIGPQGCFNPVLGFYCPATVSAASRHSLWVCFNPVLGFYCPATHLTNLRTRRIAKFQSRSGFLLSCDSASRFSARASASCFNPVLGFYCPATKNAVVNSAAYCSFNPVLGFYCPATRRRRPARPAVPGFQSRSGFLLSCDRQGDNQLNRTEDVSIPFWVSTVLRP